MEKTSEQVYSDLLLQLGNPTIVEPDVLVGYLRDVERMYSMGHITEWQLQRARNAYEATIERDPRQGPPSGFGTLVGDRHTDPISGAAGSHPVGAGIGAAAGGAGTRSPSRGCPGRAGGNGPIARPYHSAVRARSFAQSRRVASG